MRPKLLSDTERTEALAGLDGWSQTPDGLAIRRDFTFDDFNAAFGWMSRVALVAEKLDHHPDWRNVYRTVHVVLSTHDAGGVTALDVRLARAMEDFAR